MKPTYQVLTQFVECGEPILVADNWEDLVEDYTDTDIRNARYLLIDGSLWKRPY